MKLDMEHFRTVNAERCINDFKHGLNDWSVAEWTNAIAGEAGEACNIAKKLIRFRDGVAGNAIDDTEDSLTIKLSYELADVVIYADLVATSLGFSLEDLIRQKFNMTSDKIGSTRKL